MVYIDSCEKCKNDCENGMTVSGLPHKFCGDTVLNYFCPINQGIYVTSLETARNNYGSRLHRLRHHGVQLFLLALGRHAHLLRFAGCASAGLGETYALAKDRKQKIQTSIYLWAWNENSVVRKDHDDEYVLSTYDHLMKQRIALTDEFIKRQMAEETMLTVIKTVCDSYYDFQQHAWRLPKNKARTERAERWFAAYLKRFAKYYAQANVCQIGEVAAMSRSRVLVQKTMLMESETIKEWLEHIMNDVRPIPLDEQGV